MVREAIQNAIPPARKKVQRESTRLVTEVVLFIHQILAADQQGPRKQRHTAQRVYQRLCEEMPQQPVSPRSVRRAVREWKQQRQLEKAETFISQQYEAGGEAQVDWYEAYAELGGEMVKLQVFSLRSIYSGGSVSPRLSTRHTRIGYRFKRTAQKKQKAATNPKQLCKCRDRGKRGKANQLSHSSHRPLEIAHTTRDSHIYTAAASPPWKSGNPNPGFPTFPTPLAMTTPVSFPSQTTRLASLARIAALHSLSGGPNYLAKVGQSAWPNAICFAVQ